MTTGRQAEDDVRHGSVAAKQRYDARTAGQQVGHRHLRRVVGHRRVAVAAPVRHGVPVRGRRAGRRNVTPRQRPIDCVSQRCPFEAIT